MTVSPVDAGPGPAVGARQLEARWESRSLAWRYTPGPDDLDRLIETNERNR